MWIPGISPLVWRWRPSVRRWGPPLSPTVGLRGGGLRRGLRRGRGGRTRQPGRVGTVPATYHSSLLSSSPTPSLKFNISGIFFTKRKLARCLRTGCMNRCGTLPGYLHRSLLICAYIHWLVSGQKLFKPNLTLFTLVPHMVRSFHHLPHGHHLQCNKTSWQWSTWQTNNSLGNHTLIFAFIKPTYYLTLKITKYAEKYIMFTKIIFKPIKYVKKN